MHHASRSLLTRTVLACALSQIGMALTLPAQAQAQSQQVRAYSIPAGALGDVLTRFGSDSAILLSFSSEATQGLRSAGLQGSYGVQDGFRVLLAGSGLQAVPQPNGGYLLQKIPASASAPTADSRGVAVMGGVTVVAAAERSAVTSGTGSYTGVGAAWSMSLAFDGGTVLDFGSQGPTWSNPLGANISDGSNAPLTVSCNPTVASFTVTIDGGTNAVGTTRRLSNGRQTIPYQLMADPRGRIPYTIGQQRSFVAANGTQMTIPVWGAVVANTTALPAGTYTDTLTVTLDW